MIKVIEKETGLPAETVSQVSIDVMTFNTESPTINTYYKCCDADGKVIQSGNYAIDVYVALHSFNEFLTGIEDAVLAYLTLERA